MQGKSGCVKDQGKNPGNNQINVTNTHIYVLVGLLLIGIAVVAYSAVVPAIRNQEWVKIFIFLASILFVVNIIRMRFRTLPLRINFDGDKVIIKTLLGNVNCNLEDIAGLEYSDLGHMYPRHFMVLSNGDTYDIIARKSAEEIEKHLKERKEKCKD